MGVAPRPPLLLNQIFHRHPRACPEDPETQAGQARHRLLSFVL